MKTRLKALLTISVIVMLYAIYYWVAPVVVDIKSKIPLIQKVARQELGAQVEIKDPHLKMGLSPSVWLDASYFGFEGGKSSPLYVIKPKIKIRLLPLILGKIQLAYFSCDEIGADFKIDKQGRFYIGNNLIFKSSNPKISIENSKMDISAYKIKINDELNNKKIDLNGDYFDLEKYNSKKYINLSTNSNININGEKSVINADIGFKLPLKKTFDANEIIFDGTATNINLGNISPYIKKWTKGQIQQTQGILNIKADTNSMNLRTKRIITQLAIQNLAIINEDRASSIFIPNKLTIYSIVDVAKNKVNIKQFQILSKNLNINTTGKIDKIDTNNPSLDLNLLINKSRAEAFINMLPAKNLKNIDINIVALKKYGYYSDIEGKLNIKGKSNKPSLNGEIKGVNGYIIRPLNIPKATVKVKFLGEKVNIDVHVPTDATQSITVKGNVELYGEHNTDLAAITTPNVNLEVTELILNPIHEIFWFDLGPLPAMKIAGNGNINLKIKGTKADPHLIGKLNFWNTTAGFKGIDMMLTNTEGRLDFLDKNTHLITKKAILNGKLIKIDGECTLDGLLDYYIDSNGQDLGALIKIINNSPMLEEVKKFIPPIKAAGGKINISMNLKGKAKSIEEFKLGKTILIAGKIGFFGNNFLLENIQSPIKGVMGNLEFKNANTKFDLTPIIEKSKLHIKGEVKDKNAKFEISGSLKNNSFSSFGTIKNIFQKDQIVNAKFSSDNFDISLLKDFSKYPFVPPSTRNYLNEISNPTGHINLRANIKNNNLNSKIRLHDISFLYNKINIPVKIFSGSAELTNNKLALYKVNSIADSMPILIDGLITDLFKNPTFNVYINSKPTQRFIDKYLNKNATYPLKIRGDINYSARLHGTKDSFNAKTEINLQEDSNIYYMGSTIGDLNDPIRIFLDTNVTKNAIAVNNFQYDKLISSQNGKEFISPQLGAKGTIIFNPKNRKDIRLTNFRVKTINPTDAKIFNLLFKKPMVKKGLFSSNIVINGSTYSPKLIGNLNFNGIDIPLLDTTIKDISLDFSPTTIDIKTKGDVFSNRIIAFANMENKLTPPYQLSNVDIYLGNLDINELTKSINKLDLESGMPTISEQAAGVDLKNITIKNAKIKADSILIRNIYAKNLMSDFSLDEKLLFSLDNFKFEIAQGNVTGDFKYNLLNSKSSIDIKVEDVNANSITDAMFDLPNQIFGSLTGDAQLSCNGKTHKTCMDTLSGRGRFRVAEGKMPKLGSLEYLLKAGNIVKSGVTGLTINGLVDLLSPLKTGEFENINGNFSINSGIADSIQIFSKGKDLSLFLTGTYNFSTLVADMQIYGRLSKKITTILGAVGNASLNTLFNTIPGINLGENNSDFVKNFNKIPGFELNDKSFRIFSAEIYGDINGENYVKSFKWVE